MRKREVKLVVPAWLKPWHLAVAGFVLLAETVQIADAILSLLSRI